MNSKTKVLNKFDINTLYSNKDYSFINLASISQRFYSERDEVTYFIDGFLLCFLFSIVYKKKMQRVSFDYSSIASTIFKECENNNISVYLIGSNISEVDIFVKKIKKTNPDIIIAGYRHGFFEEKEAPYICNEIIKSNASLVVAGLGAGKQECFISYLRREGYTGTSFTCGGFIRQEAGCESKYYPGWIDKLSLRSFYRMYKEPHTIKRYLLNYPLNAFLFVVSKFKKFEVIEYK